MVTAVNDDGGGARSRVSRDHYDIETDPARGLIHFTLRGEWDDAVVDRFVTDYKPMAAAMDATGGITHSLVDALSLGTLTEEVADRFPPIIRAANPRPDKRTAIVIDGLTNRAQARNVAQMVNARFFTSLSAAQDWLFSSEL